MTEISRAVLTALQSSTSLAKPILKTQCELLGYEPHSLELCHLESLAPRLLDAVSRFGSPSKVRTLRAALRSIVPAPLENGDAEGRRSSPSLERSTETAFSTRVRAILDAHGPLGWTMLEAQCERRGWRPSELSATELSQLLFELERSLRRFDLEIKTGEVCRKLELLIRETIVQGRLS